MRSREYGVVFDIENYDNQGHLYFRSEFFRTQTNCVSSKLDRKMITARMFLILQLEIARELTENCGFKFSLQRQ